MLEGLYRPDAPTAGWRRVSVPFTELATARNCSLWLRREFRVPEELRGRRVRLVFLGAFYRAEVWLNGVHLGGHEGYFAPFHFDVTDLLNYGGDNVLVVYLESPAREDPGDKRSFIGVFGDWEYKPYPTWARGLLSERFEWVVPIGLWRPVKLVWSGDVVVSVVLVDPTIHPPRARVRMYLWNMGLARAVEVRVKAALLGFDAPKAEGVAKVRLRGGERRWLEVELEFNDVELWWTWDRGASRLYELRYEVWAEGVLQGVGSTRFGFRRFEGVVEPFSHELRLNGERFFVRGVSYLSDFLLSRASPSVLRRDLELMRRANVNFVRLWAHVEPPEFYDLADELGIAVRAEAPLTGAYGRRAYGGERSELYRRAQRVVAELVLTLYNHPSVVMWAVHDRPPWIKGGAWLNRDLDELLAKLIRLIDRQERPVVLASGYGDRYVAYGWSGGSWAKFLEDASPLPVLEGAQSLPPTASPFWKLVNLTRWPPSEEDVEELAYRCLQLPILKPPYGAPAESRSLEEYVEASQAYQARLLREAVARYRWLKFSPSIGVIAPLFKDPFPAVTPSALDYYGTPKLAYEALKEALKPVKALVALGGYFEVEGLMLAYRPREPLVASIAVVNDLKPLSGARCSVSWRIVDEASGQVLERGVKEVRLPGIEDPPLLVEEGRVDVPAYTDSSHALAVEVEVKLWNGTLLDRERAEVVVRPATLLRVVVKGVNEGRVLAYIDGKPVAANIRSGVAELTVPAGTRVVVAGPEFRDKLPYAPFIRDLGRVKAGIVVVDVKAVKGAFYEVRSPMPASKGGSPLVELEVTPLEPLSGDCLLKYDESTLKILAPLGYTSSRFVVPAEVRINVSYAVGGERWRAGPVTLSWGEELVDARPAKALAAACPRGRKPRAVVC